MLRSEAYKLHTLAEQAEFKSDQYHRDGVPVAVEIDVLIDYCFEVTEKHCKRKKTALWPCLVLACLLLAGCCGFEARDDQSASSGQDRYIRWGNPPDNREAMTGKAGQSVTGKDKADG